MNHFLRRGICLGAWVAGCGMAHAQLAAVKTNALLWGEPDAEHFNGAGDSFQIQPGRDCVLRAEQDAAGCPVERGTGGVQVLDF